MNARRTSSSFRQRGMAALMAVLFLITAVIFVLSQTLGITGTNSIDNSQQRQSVNAFFLAESGLERGRSALSASSITSSACTGLAGGPYLLGAGGGSFSLSATSCDINGTCGGNCDSTDPNGTACGSCQLTSTGSLGSASRAVSMTINLTTQNGKGCSTSTPGADCSNPVLTLTNNNTYKSVAVFNLAYDRQGQGIKGTCPSTVVVNGVTIATGCSPVWFVRAKQTNADMGNSVKINAGASYPIQTTMDATNYSYVGALFPGSSASGPTVIGDTGTAGGWGGFWDQQASGNCCTTSKGGTTGSTNNGVYNNSSTSTAPVDDTSTTQASNSWCYGGDTLVYGFGGTGTSTSDSLSQVIFNSAGSSAPFGIPLTKVARYPTTTSTDVPANHDIYSEIWYVRNPDYLMTTSNATSGGTTTTTSTIGAQFTGTIGATFTGHTATHSSDSHCPNVLPSNTICLVLDTAVGTNQILVSEAGSSINDTITNAAGTTTYGTLGALQYLTSGVSGSIFYLTYSGTAPSISSGTSLSAKSSILHLPAVPSLSGILTPTTAPIAAGTADAITNSAATTTYGYLPSAVSTTTTSASCTGVWGAANSCYRLNDAAGNPTQVLPVASSTLKSASYVLNVYNINAGFLSVDDTLSGTGVTNGTKITSFWTGTGATGIPSPSPAKYFISPRQPANNGGAILITAAGRTIRSTSTSVPAPGTIVKVRSGTGALDPGATATGSISGTTLTVTAVASGTLSVGDRIFGIDGTVASGTRITAGPYTCATNVCYTVASDSGTNQTVSSKTIYARRAVTGFSGTGSITGNTLTMTAVNTSAGNSGLSVGDTVAGTGVTSGTVVTALGSNTYGGTGTYTVYPSHSIAVASTTISATPVATFFRVSGGSTLPTTALSAATICGGICSFFDNPSSASSTTSFTITKTANTDYWSSGFVCLKGVDVAPPTQVISSKITSGAWTEAVR